VVSTKRNAPIAAFGKSERFHHKTETKPGPGEYDTTHIEAMGNAGVTLKPGSPSWSLGLKLDSTIYKNMPIDTPGAKYDAHKALEMGGHLDLSHSAAIDHAPRMSRNKDNGVPGPGNYKKVVSIGKQKLSQFVTEPTIKFTKKLRLSDLPNGDPVFISHQHSSENIGKHGPGPAVHVGRGAAARRGNQHAAQEHRGRGATKLVVPEYYKVQMSGTKVLQNCSSISTLPRKPLRKGAQVIKKN
jgi:hypothetical protein